MKSIPIILVCTSLVMSINGEEAKPMIIGEDAQFANPNEFPHQVSIQIDCQHSCGGSLISDKHVLTAAHCVADFTDDPNRFNAMRMTVEVGSNHIGGGITHDVKRVSRIGSYDPNKQAPYMFKDDIAVITLEHPVTRSENVQPIQIAQADPGAGERLVVSGFGRTSNEGSVSPVLKKIDMGIVSQSECQAHWSQRGMKQILPTQICAYLKPGNSACQGDSGGPLIVERSNGRFIQKFLVGVVSAGANPCGAGIPDIYTRASSYSGYIQSEMAYGGSGQERWPAQAVDLQSPNGASPISGSSKCVPSQSGPPQNGMPFPPQDGSPYPPQAGMPILPRFGSPYPPQAGMPILPRFGSPYPPQDGMPFPPQGGMPFPPQGGMPFPPQDGSPYPPFGQQPPPQFGPPVMMPIYQG